MDRRFSKYFNKYFLHSIAQLNAVLAEIKSGGAISANVNTLQARIDLLARMAMNHCHTAAGLTIGSGDSKKIKIVNTVTYLAAGIYKSKTTAETVFGADAATALADGKFCKYLVTLPASGTPHVIQGNAGASAALALLPAAPDGEAPIGYCQVQTVGAIFTPDTTALDAGTVTDTYVDLIWPDTGAGSLATALGVQAKSVIAALAEPSTFH